MAFTNTMPGLDPLDAAALLVGVARPDARAEAEGGPVGERDRLVEIGAPLDHGDRAEHLLVVGAACRASPP